ncbi:hypothetical protein NS263_06925 [Curtobacterium oceanosedimentum]|uniref:Uncharacterized protein n=1 Tax=Curtobacterium oceanosedimentum TaxID=465820 RepID=A0ABR5S807_9MICO|nr:hypothetical protein NS263_06925 [Curtobacterium oceanosedimentum]
MTAANTAVSGDSTLIGPTASARYSSSTAAAATVTARTRRAARPPRKSAAPYTTAPVRPSGTPEHGSHPARAGNLRG